MIFFLHARVGDWVVTNVTGQFSLGCPTSLYLGQGAICTVCGLYNHHYVRILIPNFVSFFPFKTKLSVLAFMLMLVHTIGIIPEQGDPVPS
jgi:hypothetical protein